MLRRNKKTLRIVFFSKKEFSTPYNRWQYYYGNHDGNMEMEMTDIEAKTLSQPYVPSEYHSSKKPHPDYYFPAHINDFRYNLKYQNFPRTYIQPFKKLKHYNYSDFNEIMHKNEWYSFQLDMQIEEPIESNHYIQGGGQTRPLWLLLYFIVFGIIYSFYGHGIIDHLEVDNPYRKKFFPPDAGMIFKRMNDFKTKDDDDDHHPRYDYIVKDSKGNYLPRNVFRYSFRDENTDRI